jgi:hypothetical protein
MGKAQPTRSACKDRHNRSNDRVTGRVKVVVEMSVPGGNDTPDDTRVVPEQERPGGSACISSLLLLSQEVPTQRWQRHS